MSLWLQLVLIFDLQRIDNMDVTNLILGNMLTCNSQNTVSIAVATETHAELRFEPSCG